jgi:hypothetical protein
MCQREIRRAGHDIGVQLASVAGLVLRGPVMKGPHIAIAGHHLIFG